MVRFDWITATFESFGHFSRLAIRDQKTAYLRDIPLVMTYVRLILDRYDEFSLLQEWIEKCVYPALQKQT
ncbi:MAG: hypothetical protein CM15mP51_03840 [Porticoccaceae bacterium]|nr:MAG: hypothetical protein CM15mP51_03840 [Porticoccaceae bacterium]